MALPTGETTRLLRKVSAGDTNAESELIEHVYQDLRRLAAAYLRRERSGHTLQPTELVGMLAFWRYYSMDVDASFKIAKPPVDSADLKTCGTPGIIGNNEERIAVYSPFVEALLLNGRKSSCIGCHALANTGMAADGPKVPPLGAADQNLSLATFELGIRTDFMWKVANHMPKSIFPPIPWPPKP